MPRPRQRLFTPGSGATPPVLAGREAEQDVLRRCLADLATGASPPHDVALIGPRGNGYIWCPPNQPPPVTWQPGIPSLMANVRIRPATPLHSNETWT